MRLWWKPLSDGETKVYVHRGGEYELTAQTMTADSLDSLLQTLTGFPQASLQVLQTEEFGMPRYDVAWTASGDSGMESAGRPFWMMACIITSLPHR